MKTPVSVGETAGEGGAWGMAVLANFIRCRRAGQSLTDYLSTTVFVDAQVEVAVPDPADADGFDAFMDRYRRALDLEKAAVTALAV